MTTKCIYHHTHSLSDILSHPTVIKTNAGGIALSAITCGLVAKFFKAPAGINALIATTIAPSFTLMHLLDHRISKRDTNCKEKPLQIIGLLALTVLPQLVMIKIASLRGYQLSYLWGFSNTFTTLIATASVTAFYKKSPF